MTDDGVRDYCDSLSAIGIENEPVAHPADRDIGKVLESLGLSWDDCVPTIVMKADDGFVAIVIRGDTRVDFKKVKRTLGVADLRMATPDEFTGLTGLPVGAARVYLPGVRTVIDSLVFEREHLTGGSGRLDCSVKVRTSDLHKIPDSLVADVAKPAPGR